MFKTVATTVLPWILLVGVLVWVELRDQARLETDGASATAELAARVRDLEREVARLRDAVARDAELRARPPLASRPPAAAPDAVEPPPAVAATPAAEADADAATQEAEVEALLAGLQRGGLDRSLLEAAAENDAVFAALLRRLEGDVAAHPEDIEARMRLAEAYVAKLYAVPNGPARGEWASRAEGQWRQVLAEDDQNWAARFSLATSLSQWPAFLGKAPDAIAEFETLRTQQRGVRPEPRHVDTYVGLAQLYIAQGQREKADAVLREGLDRHPDDPRLTKLLR